MRNKSLNTKKTIDWRVYSKQRNHVVILLRNEKKNFYNFDTKIVNNNRMLWKTIKPSRFGKVTKHSKINLNEGEKNCCNNKIGKYLVNYL